MGRGRLGRALAAALRVAGYRADAPAGRGEVPAGDAILLCVPDAEIPAAAAAVAGAAPLVGHTSGATPLGRAGARAPRRRRALRPAPAADVHGARRRPARLRLRRGRLDRRGARRRTPARRAPRHGPVRGARRAARRLPRRRLDLLELPRHAPGRGRGARRRRRHRRASTPARCSGRSCARPSRTGSRWGARDALTGPIARGDEATVARQRAAVASSGPELLAAVRRPAPSAPARCAGGGMKIVRTVAELREALGARAPRGPMYRPRADDGLLPRGAPGADARARARQATWWWSRCSSTPRSSGPRRTSTATRATRRATPSWPSAEGVDVLFAPPVEEVYPAGFAATVAVGGLTEVLDGDPSRAGREHFDGVTTVVAKLFNMVQPDARLVRPEGRPAGARDPQAGARPRLPRADRGGADGARGRRARDELAQRLPDRSRSASGRLRLSRALDAAARRGGARRTATPRRCSPPREPGARRARASSRSTWSFAPRTTSRPPRG